MDYKNGIAARLAVATGCVLFLSTAAFAQQDYRPQDQDHRQQDQNRRGDQDHRDYRADRISTQGRITAMQRVGDQFRITLNSGRYTYYVPADRLRNREPRIGVQVRIGGIVQGDVVNSDMIAFSDEPYYNNDPNYRAVPYGSRGWLSGTVTDVNRRLGYLSLRDDADGRIVKVDTRHLDSRMRLNARRGDHLSVNGSWEQRNLFDAARIEF